MWQFLLVAAVAGFFSNRLRAAKSCRPSAGGPIGKGIEKCDRRHPDELETRVDSVESQVSSPIASLSQTIRVDECVPIEEGVFRFSSPGAESRNGSRLGARNLGKKGVISEKTGSLSDCAVRFGEEKKKGVRRFCFRLKRRRIGRNLAANKLGSCLLKGGCSFGWGLGMGIMMYMISTRKSEISELNSAMDKAANSIKEIKADLDKRRSSSSKLIDCSVNEVKTNTTKCDGEPNQEHNDGDSPSSVLTEERDQDLIEIDQLEAEFVLELQKLPWCTEEEEEASQSDSMSHNLPAFDLVKDAEDDKKHQSLDPYQFHGVNPSELEQKLSLLLIEQQENQIMDLKSELGMARLKLNWKEDELQALKDRLRRLTEFSLSTVTDDETEAHEVSVGCADNWDYSNMMGSESKQSVVVMKRSNID